MEVMNVLKKTLILAGCVVALGLGATALMAGGGGGGGGGGGKKDPLVPPIAELKLLLSMQKDVNDRTEVIDQNAQKVTQENLDGQKKLLGDKEGVISDMTKKINEKLQKANGGGGPSSSSF
jgi:hypothetical protein